MNNAASTTDLRGRWSLEALSKWVPAAVFIVYAALPTQNYYWDGVSFAQNIEQAGKFGTPWFWLNLIHPNHLLYNSLGYLAWTGLQGLGMHVRAITVLQVINMTLAAVCVGVLQRTLLRLTQSVYLSSTLALLFAFSAVFWKFATDADAYIPSVLLLVASFHVLCISSKPRPLVVGALHAGAMLIHQLAIFFFPAAALGVYLRSGKRGLVQYCALTGGITLPAYYLGFWLQQHSTGLRAFVHWLTYHSADSAFTFGFVKNLVITLANYPRLLFGGTGHLLRYFGPFMLVTVLLLAAVLGMLLVSIIRHSDELKLLRLRFAANLALLVSSVWLASYALFLFFWLPSNTFYKLFCLPAIIIVIFQLFTSYRGPQRYRLALLVATMALANLAFYIFPYSRPDYNQGVRFAHRMEQVWSDRTVVYYSDFIVDDWYIRYFNPRTTWKQMSPINGAGNFAQEAERDIDAGSDVWVDGTAAAVLTQSGPATISHLKDAQEDNSPKHPIHFYRWRGNGPKL